MTTWPVVSLADVASPEKGSIISGPFGSNIGKRFFVESGVPVIRGNNLANQDAQFTDDGFVYLSDEKAAALNCWAVPDDLIFTAAGSLGQVGLIPKDGRYSRYVISNKQLRIRLDKTKIAPVFAFYYFSSPDMREYVRNQNKGSSVPLITLGVLRSLPISRPPIAMQYRIAAILSAYDDLIENNCRRIKLLEEMAHRIYHEWFVDFRYPGPKDVPHVDSELGSIPKGWQVAPLGAIASVSWGDLSTTKAKYVDAGYPAYSASGMDGFLPYFDHDRDGIVLSAIGANCGKTWVASGKWSCIKNTMWFRPSRPTMPIEYLYFATGAVDFWPRRGAAQPFIALGDARDVRLIVPPDNLLAAFRAVVSTMVTTVANLNAASDNLRMTRDLLVPRIMSGQIDVGERRVAMDEAAG